MTRNATLSLEGFDPDVLEAARDVARRAGVPVETWIASIVEPEAAGAAAAESKAVEAKLGETKPGETKPVDAKAVERTEKPPAKSKPSRAARGDGAPKAEPKPEEIAAPAGIEAALSEMMRRLDALDQRSAREPDAARTSPAAQADEPAPGTTNAMALRIAEIERRMTEIGERIAAPRAIGRRGRPAVTEIRDAVSEIRQRQRELSGEATPQPEAGRTGAPAIAELQNETSRLRESIGSLASGRDVGALEQAMHALAAGVEKAQAPAELAAIAAPIELLRVQVARLAEDVAENVHARVAADVERLAAKVEGALHGAPAGLAEADAHAGLYRELDEIRRLIGSLAGPERIQSLATGMQAISNQIAQLQDGMPGRGGMAELRPILEEIRSGLRSGPDAGIGERIDEMGAKLDALRGSAPAGFDGQSDAILHRLDALAEKVDRVHINPVGDLIGRLEDLGATLRRPVVPGEDIASIHAMLHDLAIKLDRIGTGDGPRDEGLDALEQQVLALAQRIDTRDADPAIAGLQRTMSDLLDQVSALRAEAPIEAAAERAARHALAESMGSADAGEVGLLRASLADLRAHQVASEQRMQSTLTGVYAALERLVGRLGTTEADAAAPVSARTLRETLAERANAVTPRTETLRAERRLSATPQNAGPDLPLEPGAGRPSRECAAEGADAPLGADSDIKSSFIAAARRAAQAAQAEAAGQAGSHTSSEARDASDEAAGPGRFARLRSGIDRRRKPLLLGLAAVVLMLGAIQAVTMRRPADPAATPVVEARSAPERDGATGQPQDAKGAEAQSADSKSAGKVPDDPQTTQSLGQTPALAQTPALGTAPAAAARIEAPRVAALAALNGDLAGVPPALGKLRQATLDGDGSAAYDLAARAAEGRGMPRDVALAARIFEALGTAGYAPAQYKLGSLHEKGVGLPRDLTQAKLWYGRAAERGNARAMHNLAVIHAENPAAGGKPDFATAAQWFKRGAEFGLRDSQYNLAVLYARGMGVPQDLEQSYLWFSAAAAQGDTDAAKKRDDVAAKLEPKVLAAAKAQAAAFRAKTPDPAANEPPAPIAVDNAMSLLGAPPPNPGTVPPARRI